MILQATFSSYAFRNEPWAGPNCSRVAELQSGCLMISSSFSDMLNMACAGLNDVIMISYQQK